MTNDKRLIETAFPLTEASAASLHEKNMRHGHISTLHLWPARRPLAASRAAIAAALMSDPATEEARAKAVRRLGGRLVPKKKGKTENGRAVEMDKVEADGGILWWGKESSPDLDWFRRLRSVTRHEITAAGGISTIEEIRELARLSIHSALGMAIYTGRLDLTNMTRI